MKINKNIVAAALVAAASFSAFEAEACTNFIVGKKASADGSVMCTYNADDYGMFINLCHYPAAKHSKGEMRKVMIGIPINIMVRFLRLPRHIM